MTGPPLPSQPFRCRAVTIDDGISCRPSNGAKPSSTRTRRGRGGGAGRGLRCPSRPCAAPASRRMMRRRRAIKMMNAHLRCTASPAAPRRETSSAAARPPRRPAPPSPWSQVARSARFDAAPRWRASRAWAAHSMHATSRAGAGVSARAGLALGVVAPRRARARPARRARPRGRARAIARRGRGAATTSRAAPPSRRAAGTSAASHTSTVAKAAARASDGGSEARARVDRARASARRKRRRAHRRRRARARGRRGPRPRATRRASSRARRDDRVAVELEPLDGRAAARRGRRRRRAALARRAARAGTTTLTRSTPPPARAAPRERVGERARSRKAVRSATFWWCRRGYSQQSGRARAQRALGRQHAAAHALGGRPPPALVERLPPQAEEVHVRVGRPARARKWRSGSGARCAPVRALPHPLRRVPRRAHAERGARGLELARARPARQAGLARAAAARPSESSKTFMADPRQPAPASGSFEATKGAADIRAPDLGRNMPDPLPALNRSELDQIARVEAEPAADERRGSHRVPRRLPRVPHRRHARRARDVVRAARRARRDVAARPRVGQPAHESAWRWRHTPSYWVAILFCVGSAFFVIGSAFGMNSKLSAVQERATVARPFFVGSIAFTLGSYFGFYHIVNVGREHPKWFRAIDAARRPRATGATSRSRSARSRST